MESLKDSLTVETVGERRCSGLEAYLEDRQIGAEDASLRAASESIPSEDAMIER